MKSKPLSYDDIKELYLETSKENGILKNEIKTLSYTVTVLEKERRKAEERNKS